MVAQAQNSCFLYRCSLAWPGSADVGVLGSREWRRAGVVVVGRVESMKAGVPVLPG